MGPRAVRSGAGGDVDVDVFVDLDETLVHSRSVLAVSFDLPLLYGSRSGMTLTEMRDAFDAEVAVRLGVGPALAPAEELARVRSLEQAFALEHLYAQGWARVPTTSEDRMVGLRPGADAFLEAIATLGARVHLCSAATLGYSRSCLEAFGLDGHFDEIWARDALEEGRARRSERPFLLVDNLPFEEADVQRKLRCLAGSATDSSGLAAPGAARAEQLRAHHLEIVAWRGHDADDALATALGRVRSAVHALAAR